MLSKWSDISVEIDDNSIVLLKTCKCHQSITDANKKLIRDYYLDPANVKPVYKYVQK